MQLLLLIFVLLGIAIVVDTRYRRLECYTGDQKHVDITKDHTRCVTIWEPRHNRTQFSGTYDEETDKFDIQFDEMFGTQDKCGNKVAGIKCECYHTLCNTGAHFRDIVKEFYKMDPYL